MELINKLIWTLFHLKPDTLRSFMEYVGPHRLYAILFAILFAETGLVVTPFLPGDSLLFAIGVICAVKGPLNVPLVLAVIFAAVLLGDNTNYWMGRRLGPAVFRRESSRLLNKKHLTRAQAFYEAYGAKTIILARFVPIVRTFAPFVAGIGRMHYGRFLTFSILGAALWISICTLAGYKLAKVEFISNHFDLVVVAIVIISVLPMVVEFLKHRKELRRGFAVKTTGEAAADAHRSPTV